ncbi:MAG: tRNA uridine-5-carboxymethylaminomethyl(34) synthesis GTPase MnmE [Desulfovibrionaceae bacterium]|nr:tRNA uridine-5-carboxymethylaminomethyl(34) synthesis GTPase MnmE [Desulfovibrionaceae bacterium]
MATIAAIATAQGLGAIGIVRISGSMAHELLQALFIPHAANFTDFKPWVLHRGLLRDQAGSLIDDVLAVYMPGPKTYTGEDMAEIHCHGNPLILQSVLQRLLSLGAMPAGPGEFTKRAFVHGRMDLSQAEAVAELVSCASRGGLAQDVKRLAGGVGSLIQEARSQVDALRAKLTVACDFPDEEIEGASQAELLQDVANIQALLRQLNTKQAVSRLWQNGAACVLVGSVNAGKSSLLNALLGHERALVSNVPGTTRDFLEAALDIDGLSVRLIDTAGLRPQNHLPDPIETQGIARSHELAATADCLVLVLDGTKWTQADLEALQCPKPGYAELLQNYGAIPKILVWNKADLEIPKVFPPKWAQDTASVVVSARTGHGCLEFLQTLKTQLVPANALGCEQQVSCNLRQGQALDEAQAELAQLEAAIVASETYDCLAVRLEVIATKLGEVIGVATPTEVLNAIFANFCIGK